MFADFDDLPGGDFLVDDQEDGEDATRPQTRGDCIKGPRPCPWVTCKYHLLTDISIDGRLILNGNADGPLIQRDRERHVPASADGVAEALASMEETCALDVADGGGCASEHVAAFLGVDQRRVEQIETVAIAKIRTSPNVVQLKKAGRR